jgi:hypothetical protein
MHIVADLLGLGCGTAFYPEAFQGQERTLPIQTVRFKCFKSEGSNFLYTVLIAILKLFYWSLCIEVQTSVVTLSDPVKKPVTFCSPTGGSNSEAYQIGV